MLTGNFTIDSLSGLKPGYTIEGETITIPNDGTSGSYLRFPLTLKPGQEVTVSFEYRVIEGPNGIMALDIDYTGSKKTYSDLLDAKEWVNKEYTFKVPVNKNGQYSRLAFGVTANVVATIQFRNIHFHTKREDVGNKPEVFAVGVIKKGPDDTVIANGTSANFGIISGELYAADRVRLTLDISLDESLKSRPHFMISGTTDSPLVPVIGSPHSNEDGTSTIDIMWSDGDAFKDVTGMELYATMFAFV